MFGLQPSQVKDFAEIRIYWLTQATPKFPTYIQGRSVPGSYNCIIERYSMCKAKPGWGLNNLNRLFQGADARMIDDHRKAESEEIRRFMDNPRVYLDTNRSYPR